ncbi:MAG: pyrroloquinoline quinone biosynthesis protein PqqB [Planctomycetes bacterium]|nr:pyrroloquinoline quinone biosynthesis protein PqqB [Planctomycetota bacterium]
MSQVAIRVLFGTLLLIHLACSPDPEDAVTSGSRTDRPYAVVLGTAQDGGLPQIGCRASLCLEARRNPERRRLVTSLLLVDPRTSKRWLFDASPDLSDQVARADTLAPLDPAVSGRPPLFDGIFLTHAHVGHYAGLLQLGREAYGAAQQVVHATPRMSAFLRGHGPWSLLVDEGHIRIETLEPGLELSLAADLRVRAIPVPHRDEFSDTVAFLIEGPTGSLLYLPDIDKWDRWDRPLEAVLSEVDVALIDGTFYAEGEIPGRSMKDIPHPFIEETIARLASASSSVRAKVVFTHLNHSNPASDPETKAAARVRAAGMSIAREMQRFDLGSGRERR